MSDTSLLGNAGSNPAFDVTYRGSGLARAVASRAPVLPQGRACGGVTDTDFARSQRSFLLPCAALRIGKAVVKMSVTSVERRASGGRRFESGRQQCRSSEMPSGGNSIARSPPTLFTISGEDRCYIADNEEVAGSSPARRYHATVAQLVEHCPQGHLSNRLYLDRVSFQLMSAHAEDLLASAWAARRFLLW